MKNKLSSAPAPGRRGTTALLLAAVAGSLLAVSAASYLSRPVAETEASATPAADASAPVPATGFKFALRSSPQTVPDLRFIDGKGKPFALADFRGKTIVLNIWATWCPPCRAEMPTLDRLQAKLGGPDFEVIAVSIDRGDSALVLIEEFFREVGVHQFRIYIDPTGQAASELGSIGLPTTLLIDREGKEVGRLIGGAEWDSPEVIAFIERRLGRAQQRSARTQLSD